MSEAIIRFEGITKRFPGVLALDGVSFSIARGTVHALAGENGAGKSTLGRIVAGIHRADRGRMTFEGRELALNDPRDALARGISMVHQELGFCENLSVAENLCLSDPPRRGPFVSRGRMRIRARRMLEAIGAELDVDRRVGELSIALQQMVQIAQAVALGARIIVFDEPSSSLTVRETDRLFDLIRRLRERGVTMIYVTHRLREIFQLCDAATVLRDGRHVATQPVCAVDEKGLIHQMIGRKLEEYFPRHSLEEPGEERLAVRDFSSPGKFRDVSFTVRAGEVLGLAGLVGAGRSEVARALFGLDPRARGQVRLNGREVRIRSPRQAMEQGLGLLPEDRKREGLVLGMTCRANVTLAILKRLAIGPFIRKREERRLAEGFFQRLDVRVSSPDAQVMGLSGGNQQKIVLAKWLAARPRVLIADEPTRGIDVGAKAAIHAMIDDLARQGLAIILITSELPEALNLSTRILVMREGRVAGEFSRGEATQEGLMRLMAGAEGMENSELRIQN